MFRMCLKLAAVVFASVIFIGCESDNPAPTADQSSPNAGVNALDQMKQGGTGPQTSADLAKKKDAKKK